LFFKIDEEYHYILKTFLLFIDRLPTRVDVVGVNIKTINADSYIYTKLKEI